MSEQQEKKIPIKIKTLSNKPQEEDSNPVIETEITPPKTQSEGENISKQPLPSITTEISIPRHPQIVGEIPPWDDDKDSQQDDKSKPPTITTEIPFEEEKLSPITRSTGEIPPWDDEDEIKQ